MAADSESARRGEPKTKVFISYSRKDMAFADRLDAALKSRGFEPLVDREEVYAFENWWARIQALIAEANTVIFVLSPDSVSSPICSKEVAFAASLNKHFAPIALKGADEKLVPEALARLNFIFFDDDARFGESLDRLCDALQTDIEWIRKHTEYGEEARRWEADGRAIGLLLRSPVLDQAEAWMAFRPQGAPPPTALTETFIAASRKAEVAARRRSRILEASLYTMLVSIILGLIGWINQATLANQWRWVTRDRPFVAERIWPYVLKAQAEQALKPGNSFRECAPRQPNADYCPDMVVVPAGTFAMGSPPTDKNALTTELPQHPVTIAAPFAVSRFELTFDEWDTCFHHGGCIENTIDAGFGRGENPVTYVNWNDAQQYVAWLSRMTGKHYRLLSEAEYEYSTRARTTTEYPWGNELQFKGQTMANCAGCGSQWDGLQTAPVGAFRPKMSGFYEFVGTFPPNKFGLHDMVGNVFEWVQDCYHPTYQGAPGDGSAWLGSSGDDCKRVVRGGSWNEPPVALGSAFRYGNSADARVNFFGFRVARTLSP